MIWSGFQSPNPTAVHVAALVRPNGQDSVALAVGRENAAIVQKQTAKCTHARNVEETGGCIDDNKAANKKGTTKQIAKRVTERNVLVLSG